MMTLVTRLGSESDAGCVREMGEDVYHLAAMTPPPRVIVDIGANIGAFSILAASMFPDCTIRAFEPEPENFGLLEANVDAYGFGDRITIIRAAVTDNRDGVDIHPGHGLSHVCTTPTTERCDAHWIHSEHRAPAPSVTLADAVKGLKSVDLLKVDTEGSEFEIFGGASPATMAKIRRLRMEIHDYRTQADLEALWVKLSETLTMTVPAFVPTRGGYWFGDR
jgi:FkbM family methyltransferase